MSAESQVRIPANSLELIKWLIFEPVLLKKYSASLNKKQAVKEFLKAYAWITLFSVCLWVLVNLVVTILDMPWLLPDFITGNESSKNSLTTQTTWFSSFIVYSINTAPWLIKGLAFWLIIGSAIGFVWGLAVGLAGGLAGGLVSGLAVGFIIVIFDKLALKNVVEIASGFPVGLSYGLAIGLVFGLNVRLTVGLARRLAGGLVVGLIFWIIFILSVKLIKESPVGGFIIGYLLTYFRIIPFYIFYLVKSRFSNDLLHNPYRRDGFIWLPIWGLDQNLLEQAGQKPGAALDLVNFLIDYRPLQKNLAMKLTHAATAGMWQQHEFSADILKTIPLISKDKPKYQPSPEWLQSLAAVRAELVAAELQSSIGYKLEYYRQYLSRVKEFADITRRKESSRWNRSYFTVIEKWLSQAQDEYGRLQLAARTMEPITRNVYRSGEALTPEYDREIFLGRNDLRDELQHKILTSARMPLFLIHGQRRVGKTSLLKFLPGILGPRFKVVYMDVQPIAGIYQWLDGLKTQFDQAFGIDPAPLPAPNENNWAAAWQSLQNHLHNAAQKQECKIILAFDEYEKIHKHLQKQIDAAEELLDAMRSFSQHQDKIVFLFVGAALFTELKDPHWSNYFVQAAPLKVDYLKKEDTLKLIAVAPLVYPAEVTEEIFRLTQGHPALVQRICHEMVNIANTQHRKQMFASDLDQVLTSHIYRQQNGVVEVFWGQFCGEESMKTTVRQIIDGKQPTDKKSLFKLLEHGFVLPEKDYYKMRAPIFTEWVKRFGDVMD